MWNSASLNPLVDSTMEDMAGSAEKLLPLAKRQRRPSVRLHELGDQAVATVPDTVLARNNLLAACTQEGPNDSKKSRGITAEGKATKSLPFRDESFQEPNSSNVSDDPQACLRPAYPPSLHHTNKDSQAGNGRRREPLKIASKKGAKMGPRRAGPRTNQPVWKPKGPSLSHRAKNFYDANVGNDLISDEEGIPETARDYSMYMQDGQEVSNVQTIAPLMKQSLFVHQGSQFQLVNGVCTMRQDDEKCLVQKAYTDNLSRMTIYRRQGLGFSSDVHANSLPKAKKTMEGTVKLISDVNRKLEDGEPSTFQAAKPSEQHQFVARQHSPRIAGVKGWLRDLGLDRYAQIYEDHEVDMEVLPLLTLDDLKEMGITAVGTRRKMLFAIQQLQKGMAGRSD